MGILHRSGSLKSLCALTRLGLKKRSPFCRLSSDVGYIQGAKSSKVHLGQNEQEILDRSIRTCLHESDPHTMVDLFKKALETRTPPWVRTIDVAMDVFSRARAEDRVGLIFVHRALMGFNLLTDRVLKAELALCNNSLLKDTMIQLCWEIPKGMWTPDMCHYIAARFEFLYGGSERWVMEVLQFFAAHNAPLRADTVEKILRWTSSSHLKSAPIEVQCYLLDTCIRRCNSPLAILEIFSSCPEALNKRHGFLLEVCILCIDDRTGHIRYQKKREIFELISTLQCWDRICSKLVERYEDDLQKLLWFLNSHAKEAFKTSMTTWKSILAALKKTTTEKEEKVAIFSDLINSSPTFLEYVFEASLGISSTKEKEEVTIITGGYLQLEESRQCNDESNSQKLKNPGISEKENLLIGGSLQVEEYKQCNDESKSQKLKNKISSHADSDRSPAEVLSPSVPNTPSDKPTPVNPENSIHTSRISTREQLPVSHSQRQPGREILTSRRESNLNRQAESRFLELQRLIFDRLLPSLPVNLPPIIPYLMNHIRPRELVQVLERFEKDISEIPELAQSQRSREAHLTKRLQEAFEAQVTLSSVHVRRARGLRPIQDRTPKSFSDDWSSFGDRTRR